MAACLMCTFAAMNLKLKTQPKQLLGSPPLETTPKLSSLDFGLPELPHCKIGVFLAPSTMKQYLIIKLMNYPKHQQSYNLIFVVARMLIIRVPTLAFTYKLTRGAQNLMGDNLKVVWVEFSTLS
jgi:hypothetical protein